MSRFDIEGEMPSDATVIQQCIIELVSDPRDDRYVLLDAICHHVSQSFPDFEARTFAQCLGDPKFRRDLLDNPAAATLLAYAVLALRRLNGSGLVIPPRFDPKTGDFVEEPQPRTADRRAALARAFCLVGKSGQRSVSIGRRMGIGVFFEREVNTELHAARTPVGPVSESAAKKAVRAALRRVYRWQHGEDYIHDLEAHRARMGALRKLLDNLGYGDLLRGQELHFLPPPKSET